MALSQGSLEERFSHLLKPIRDLAENWDINIADYLEEYLEDLERIEITFSDGITTMNFSEAALLIQGSAGVYAKKVEYLHSLVCHVLDLLTQKKVKSSENGEGGEEGDVNENEDDQFLPLDIQEGSGIYLAEKDVFSDKGIRLIQEMPTRLIPLEEAEKGDNILYNKKGEVVGNHCDFNINIGQISADGSILLELGDSCFLTQISPLAGSQKIATCTEGEQTDKEDAALDTGVDMDGIDEVDHGVADVVDEADHGDADGDFGDSDQLEAPAVAQNARRSERKVTFARPPTKPKPVTDPWAQLDPHEPSKMTEKPLVKKKPFKIPAELQDKTAKKRKLKKEIKRELTPLHEIVEKAFSNRLKFPKNPLKVPAFPELEEAFRKEFKIREAIKKEEMKLLKKEEREELWEDEEDGVQALPCDDDNDFGDDVEDIPRLELDLDLLAQTGSMKRTMISCDTGFQTGYQTECCEDPTATLTYENLVQKYVEKFYASAAEYAQITDLSRRVAEWEEKIQPRLEEEESHETFDIHIYGTFVINQCVRGEPIAFREIVRGKKEYEICRYLLSTLQLANVYNVELSLKPDESGNLMDCLYVKLLSTKRHFEDLEEYRAPSNTDVFDKE